jgi:hypothetical protein
VVAAAAAAASLDCIQIKSTCLAKHLFTLHHFCVSVIAYTNIHIDGCRSACTWTYYQQKGMLALAPKSRFHTPYKMTADAHRESRQAAPAAAPEIAVLLQLLQPPLLLEKVRAVIPPTPALPHAAHGAAGTAQHGHEQPHQRLQRQAVVHPSVQLHKQQQHHQQQQQQQQQQHLRQ